MSHSHLQADGTMTRTNDILHGKLITQCLVKLDKVTEQLKQACNVVMQQTSPDFMECLVEFKDCEQCHTNKDLPCLLQCTEAIAYKFTTNQEPIIAVWATKSDFMKLTQAQT